VLPLAKQAPGCLPTPWRCWPILGSGSCLAIRTHCWRMYSQLIWHCIPNGLCPLNMSFSMPSTRLALLAVAFLLLAGCNGFRGEEMRLAWRPDSSLTGADSCIQRFWLTEGNLASDVWCPRTAEAYLSSHPRIKVILSRKEEAAICDLALQAMAGSSPDTLQTHQIKARQAFAYFGSQRTGFSMSLDDAQSAGNQLINKMQSILDQRRKKATP
jgi:hypothetical protein